MIHSQAIVDPSARLADDVTVGPWSLIGPEVEIGPGTIIEPQTTSLGLFLGDFAVSSDVDGELAASATMLCADR